MSTLEANVRPDIDLKVVGQLVSAAGLLPGFPSETAIADFLVPVLHGIPGCQSVRFCFRKLAHPIGDAPEEACPICTRSLDLRAETGAYACGLVTPGKVRSYSLETVTGFYGHLLLAVEPEGGFENYAFLIRNLCNALATLLENRSQRVALLKANDDLEQRVEERTAELRQNLETAVLSRQAMLSALEDRQQAELALKESEYRYAMAQRAANIGTWDRNMQTGQLHWSERIAPLFGFAPGGFAGTYEAFLQCIHPEDRQAVIDAVDDSVSKHQVFSFEHRIVWPDGSIRWVSETGELIWDEQESVPVRMLGIVQNITERKQAEEKLRLAGIYNRSLLEASLDPLVTISSEGKITDVN
ncbi:PAS domain-containing protein, partial [bacterium]|nr:PAS domain-containing protein [bacterium]